jgi:hypothetical protein
MLASNYPFADAMWTILVFFVWIAWFFLLIRVFTDIFRRHDISGWGKTGWIIFTLVLPFLGVFIYLIANSHGMADRDMAQMQDAKAQTDAYIQSVAGGGTEQIAKAKELLDSGAITQAEFDQLKARALAS